MTKPALQNLWRRVNRAAEERAAVGDGLPMSRDVPWFRTGPHKDACPRRAHLPSAHIGALLNPCTVRGSRFRHNFLKDEATVLELGREDDIWPCVPDPAHGALPHRAPSPRCTAEPMHHARHRFVRGFNEYDGLATVVAATANSEDVFSTFLRRARTKLVRGLS